MYSFTEVFKTLSDLTRFRIMRLFLSALRIPLCVCEIVDALEEPQYNVSRHLSILKRAGLLNETKDGRWVYYSIQPSRDSFVLHLHQAIGSISHEILQADQQRLQERLKLRKDGKCLVGIQKTHLSNESCPQDS